MLSMSRLPWMNLRGYPVRTGTLVFFSMLMTMTIFGGTLVVQGIEHGLRTTQSRLGADIMVTPDEADTEFDAQTFLVGAEPSYFYMDASTVSKPPPPSSSWPRRGQAAARAATR